jgi:signal peptidase I
MSEPTPPPSERSSQPAAPSSTSSSGASAAHPDRRPPRALRLFIEHLWILAAPLYLGLFLGVVYATNHIDLSHLPSPRALQALAAAAILMVLGAGPYYAFRAQIDWARHDLLLYREAVAALRDAKRRLKSSRATGAARTAVEATLASLEQAIASEPPSRVHATLDELDAALNTHLPAGKKGATREYTESIGVAVLIALILRAFLVEAFKIPSGSMIPTLQVGDHIFVSKFLYGVRIPWTNLKLFKHVREPRRGEIIVFVYPQDPEKDFIKRIVAIAGDTVQVCGGQVLINNQPLRRELQTGACEYDDFDEDRPMGSWRRVACTSYREWNGSETYMTVHNPGGGMATQGCGPATTIPAEHVFVMGDNRDNSHDSRFWGPVHYDLIKGKAWFIWWSAGEKTSVRLNRMFDRIHR